MSKFTHNERSDIYTAERSDIYTAERSDIYTAERSDIYTAERSDIYTNQEDDGTVGTTTSNQMRHDPPDRNRYQFGEKGKQEPNDDWNLATQQKRAATAPSSTPPVSTHSPVQDYGPQFVPVVCVDDSGVTHAPPISTVTNGEHGRPTAKAELEDVPMMHYLQAKCQKCFGCIIALACAAIVAIVALVVVVLTQSSGSTVAPMLLTGAPAVPVTATPAPWNVEQSMTPATTPVAAPSAVRLTARPAATPMSDAATSLTRAELIVAYINSIKLSEGTFWVPEPPDEEDDTEQLPELEALGWLIYTDPLQLSPDDGDEAQFRLRQRYALLTLLVQVSGFLTSVVLSNDECDWDLVGCSLLYDPPEVFAIQSGDATVRGTVPVDLGLLSSLTKFNVPTEDLTGWLPPTIGLWTNLEEFDVRGNTMTGTLPSSIGSWTKLSRFEIEGNNFIGTLPSAISAWVNLTYISVEENELSGTIPLSLLQASNLESASFAYNLFNESMPFCNGDSLATEVPVLEFLWADCLEVTCPCCTDCQNTTDSERGF